MKIMKNEEYDNMRATIKRLLDENIKLQQDLYAVRRECNFYKYAAGEWKDLSFPNSEVKKEGGYKSPEIEAIKDTVSDFWNSIYKSADSDGSNNY